ncbi:MAG: response regulator transcription factor [Anaerolineales bacterium]|nr:response regulator transcription factor [Anaerolineales bacterium]MBS3752074.1 response regulator transcription factor [Anaerolineales bacterium]
MSQILIVEDERELVKVLRSYLEKENFSVLSAYRGDTGYSLWEKENPDLVLLDLNLPGMNGLDFARKIRQQAQTPLIMITARVEESDQLVGLEIGADDYITKPFSPRIVVAKVRALLRRAQAERIPPKNLTLGDIEIDIDAHTVTKSGSFIELTPTEFDLLRTLASQPGRAFSRKHLLEATQEVAYEGYERSIDTHIKNLRAKIEPDPHSPKYIETVFGIGYRANRELG